MTLRIERTLTDEMMHRWAELTSDYNPLHVDSEYASSTRFERPIVFATITVAMVADALEAALGDRWTYGGRLDVRFVAPVYVGDTFAVSCTTDGRSKCSIEVESAGVQPLVAEVEPGAPSGSEELS